MNKTLKPDKDQAPPISINKYDKEVLQPFNLNLLNL